MHVTVCYGRPTPMSDSVPAFEIEQQLARMLRSRRFIRAASQARVLQFLVSQKLQKVVPTEFDIAQEVFGRKSRWTDQDTIVRVNCVRLASNLAEYYLREGSSDPVEIRITAYTVVAEFRAISVTAPTLDSGSLEKPLLEACLAFFTSPDDPVLRCVVTGDAVDVRLHVLDGDIFNVSLGNLVPLCGRLRSHIEAMREGRRKTGIPDLDPKRLADRLALRYFLEGKVANAYGCVALAFHLGVPPFGEEPDHLRALQVSDIVYYARHRFLEPLIHHVLQGIVLPFLVRIDAVDAVAALRLSIQLTALLEEAGYYEDAQHALSLADSMSRKASRESFGRGAPDAFTLWRRRAQLFAERAPDDARFDGLLDHAQEHVGGAPSRALNLQIVQAHRWLRQGSHNGLKKAYDMLAALRVEHPAAHFRGDSLDLPPGFATAELSELLLLFGITACRLRPGGWKRDCDDAVSLSKTLARVSGHVLPVEYNSFIAAAIKDNYANAAHMLRRLRSEVRPPLRDEARANVAVILKCLERLRVLKMKAQER